jgi:stage II sporulation protein D
MKRVALPFAVFAFACSTATPPYVAPPPPAAHPGEGAGVPLNATVRPPNAMTPIATLPKTIAVPRIRVGMLSDQQTFTFARVDGGYYISCDSGASILKRGFTAAAPLRNAPVRYAVQAAAISDRDSATAFTQKIQTETAQRADAIFDPSASNGGIYRILVGDFPDSQSANPLRDQLVQRGYATQMTIVRRPSDQPFEKRIEITDDEGDKTTIAGESILVMPVSADTVSINDKPYRTAARLFVNSRGLLNIINELNLEDYLKGVVPAEMGPKQYDELEALKAQAVAARTYAVRNLNQFHTEGFDICPGPACQAYVGFGGEDPLTSRAVTDTAGLVMTYQGQLVDALYTATCGGETSDVHTMFPARNEPYLKRARCVELDMLSLAGRSDSGMLTEQQVSARVFAALANLPERESWSARDVQAGVRAVMNAMGFIDQLMPQLASSRRGDVLRFLGATLKFSDDARTLTLPEDRKYFFPQSGNDDAAYLAAAFLIKWGMWPTQEIDHIDLNAAMPREELYAILNSWMRKHEMLTDATGKIAALDGRRLTIKNEGKLTAYALPEGIPIFRRLGDRFEEYANVPVMIGDRAVVSVNGRKVPVALIVVGNYDGAAFDRTSSFSNWTRSYRADELVKSINNRNPIQQLIDLHPVTVDASQRVAEMEVTAEGGRKFILRGLPVRWSLNVPDNLFVFEKTKDADGTDRYTFYGKGWGHGVGMCQTGAFGMAFRGWTFDRILRHFYAGIEIGAMK